MFKAYILSPKRTVWINGILFQENKIRKFDVPLSQEVKRKLSAEGKAIWIPTCDGVGAKLALSKLNRKEVI